MTVLDQYYLMLLSIGVSLNHSIPHMKAIVTLITIVAYAYFIKRVYHASNHRSM